MYAEPLSLVLLSGSAAVPARAFAVLPALNRIC